FTIFDPLRVGDLPPPPKPLLTALELDNRNIEPNDAAGSLLREPLYRTSRLALPAGSARSLNLGFASPYFVAPDQWRFSTRLEGFSDNWVEADARRHAATYTNLEPGDYLFRVRVRTTDAVWIPQEARLAIAIEPFWWQTWFARIVAVLALVAGVW